MWLNIKVTQLVTDTASGFTPQPSTSVTFDRNADCGWNIIQPSS